MEKIRITTVPQKLNGSVILPASKSISNRALVICALTEHPFIIQNLSNADDTVLLDALFQSNEKEIYVRNAREQWRVFFLPIMLPGLAMLYYQGAIE